MYTAAVCVHNQGALNIIRFYHVLIYVYSKYAYCREDTACIWVFTTQITLFYETCVRNFDVHMSVHRKHIS